MAFTEGRGTIINLSELHVKFVLLVVEMMLGVTVVVVTVVMVVVVVVVLEVLVVKDTRYIVVFGSFQIPQRRKYERLGGGQPGHLT